MIAHALVRSLSAELEALRGEGRDLYLFDSRDRGNYGGYNLERDWDLLERTDPTGFASALLLDEMIEATIRGSKLPLDRVLREDGYLDRVRQVLDIKDRLLAGLDEPRAAFTAKVTAALATISPEYGELAPREVACCLRDALFSLDTGLTLHWLRCDPVPASGPLPLSAEVLHFANMPDFVKALQYELPFGAFVGCINHQDTVLGFKQPGRVAYLARYRINTHSGQMWQDAKSGSNLAERFDLGHASERFPDWTPERTKWGMDRSHNGSSHLVEPSRKSNLSALADLPRDVVLWVALLTEMMRQRLPEADPATVVLTESMLRALPAPARLPVVQSNFTLVTPPLESVFDSLDLEPGVRAQMQPALEGLSLDHMLPVGEVPLAINRTTKEMQPWLERSDCFSMEGGPEWFNACHTRITPVSANLVGTREEVEAARNTILTRNLTNFLVEWLNAKVTVAWLTEVHDWFKTAVAERLPDILSHPLVMKSDSDLHGLIHFYNQSSKHKTYRAMCWLNKKLEPTCRLVLAPRNSAELVDMLGLSSEAELPELLRGWSRIPDDEGRHRVCWAWNGLSNGGNLHAHRDHLNMRHREFASQGFLVATVSINEASFTTTDLKRVNLRTFGALD